PAVSTKQNIANFREQLDRIGLSFDWSRQVNTAEPGYYKWTQWIFLQLFNSWYDRLANQTRPISELVARFEKQGSSGLTEYRSLSSFAGSDWKSFTEKQ